MTTLQEIFIATLPGAEPVLCQEMTALGFQGIKAVPGGVECRGVWEDIWRANLWLRTASRVMVRIGSFRAQQLSQLDKRSRQLPWQEFLRADVPVTVEAVCRKSRIYHSGAAEQRVAGAIQAAGIPVSKDGAVSVFVRIDHDICTVSVDTSGELLHKRGFKMSVVKAPLRETQAALFLKMCGYEGGEPVIDPMCGSGTILLEAAQIAAAFAPGRERTFAFESLSGFAPASWQALQEQGTKNQKTDTRFFGYDRDAGAVAAARENAQRAGLSDHISFAQQSIDQLTPPEGPPGLVLVNPPYGARIGDGAKLKSLYQRLGAVLSQGFAGWRVGVITVDSHLAKATGLSFADTSAPIPHGPLKIRLYQTTSL